MKKYGLTKNFGDIPLPSLSWVKLAKILRGIGEILASSLQFEEESRVITAPGGEVGKISVGSLNSFLHPSGFANFFFIWVW